MAITNNFLAEPESEQLAHSDLSAAFVTRPELLDWATYMTSTSAPTALQMIEQTETYGSSLAKNETAYNIAMSTPLPFFDHVATSQALTKRFAGYMKNVTTSDGVSIKHLVAGYDWSALGQAKIVDVSIWYCFLGSEKFSPKNRLEGQADTPASLLHLHSLSFDLPFKTCPRLSPTHRISLLRRQVPSPIGSLSSLTISSRRSQSRTLTFIS